MRDTPILGFNRNAGQRHRAGSHCHEILLDSLLELYSCRGRVAQLGEHLLCKKAGKITQVPHLVSLTRTHAVQPTS